MAGILSDINTVINYRCKRTDDRAQSRGIESVDETREVLCERVQHDRGGDVRDELAKYDRPPVLIAGNLLVEEGADRFVARDRRRENEETEERQEQHIVHAQEKSAVHDEHHDYHDPNRNIPELRAAHDRREDHDEEHQVAHAAFLSRSFPGSRDARCVDLDPPAVLFSVHNAYEHNEKYRRPNAKRRHVQHKVRCACPGLLVKEEILRAAEGHEKRAADRSDVFERDNGEYALFPTRTPEEQDRERDEDNE